MSKKAICPCDNKLKKGQDKYCSKECFYRYRVRPSGLSYKVISINKGWIKKGQRLSQETEFKKGISPISPIKRGQRISPETEFTTERVFGEKNYRWMGDKVGYGALHTWLYRRLGKAIDCKRCGGSSKRYVWHNISGEYKRNLSDWKSVCDRCHKVEHKIMKGILCQNVSL